jgi:hypothetical protein
VTVRAGAHGAVVEALIHQDAGIPVFGAVVHLAVRAVEGRQFRVDLLQGLRVYAALADGGLDGI